MSNYYKILKNYSNYNYVYLKNRIIDYENTGSNLLMNKNNYMKDQY